jgi:hypothetical protein
VDVADADVETCVVQRAARLRLLQEAIHNRPAT